MEFFIPGSTEPEKCLKQTIKNLKKQLKDWELTDKRIYQLEHEDITYTVREIYKSPKCNQTQIILLILEFITPSGKLYYALCTNLRGFKQGFPIMIGSKKNVTKIVEFTH